MKHAPLDRLHTAVARTRLLTTGRSAIGLSHDEADEAVGSIGTDSAHGFDPFPLLRALHEAGARAVVIGQVAGIMHGSLELTGDLDLLWDGDRAQSEALARAFGAARCRLLDDDRKPAVHDFLDRALTTTDADGLRVHYLRQEDLVAMRQVAGRAKDLRRNEEFKAHDQ